MISHRLMYARVFTDPHYFLAFGFGSGLAKYAPGTWGTLAAIPVYLLMSKLSPMLYLSLCIIAFIYGCWISGRVADDLDVHDYKGIVWDEVVGYWLTMFMIPATASSIILGFILFRIFDIIKPPPIRWVDQHVGGGLGIMLDDVLAALFAWIIMLGSYKAGFL